MEEREEVNTVYCACHFVLLSFQVTLFLIDPFYGPSRKWKYGKEAHIRCIAAFVTRKLYFPNQPATIPFTYYTIIICTNVTAGLLSTYRYIDVCFYGFNNEQLIAFSA